MQRSRLIVFLGVVFWVQSELFSQTIFDAVRSGDTVQAALLFRLKPDTINARNENGFTPLVIAVYRRQDAVMRQLLRLGARVNDNPPEGPAIVAAAYKSDVASVRFLLANGAQVDLANEEGVTALMYAVMNNQPALVKLLLDAGANPEKISKTGQSALSFAKSYAFSDLVKLLTR